MKNRNDEVLLKQTLHLLKTVSEMLSVLLDRLEPTLEKTEIDLSRATLESLPIDALFFQDVPGDSGLKTRVKNALRGYGIKSVGDLVSTTEYDLCEIPNLGVRGRNVIKVALAFRNLSLKP